MRNIRLVLEYDGTDFSGWQCQPELRTIQGEVERSLSQVTQEKIKLTTAGRTDTGVHALGQVANFFTKSRLPVETFKRGGNAVLPKDIRILDASQVSDTFNSRFSAKARHYHYIIRKTPFAIGRSYAWYIRQALDVPTMNSACKFLVGENDFQSFCQAGANVTHYRSNVLYAKWTENNEQITFEIGANRFLHNMVRILVGTFVDLGKHKLTVNDISSIIEEKDRRVAGQTAPALGLFLVRVEY